MDLVPRPWNNDRDTYTTKAAAFENVRTRAVRKDTT